MELTLREEDAANWVYRGEGAVNLVLAYNGSNPSFVGKVMRIRKAPKNSKHGLKSNITVTAHELLLWKDVNELVSSSEKDIIDQLYVEHVMMPLLGSKYVDAGVHVLVSRKFLESIEKIVISQRPVWRVDAAQIDKQCDFGLLMSDHSVFPHDSQGSKPCISVEIKPKWGFLPQSRFVSEGNAIKTRVTRFEMHQALKLHQGAISELSQYNPLDLFSGSKERIRKAIKDLFITPQNNFRVFLNGVLILGGLGGGTRKTDSHLAEAFEERLKSVIEADKGHCTENLFTLVAETMHKSRVLDQLLEVQKLDNFDIEGAIHAYYNVISQPCMACRELNEEQAKQYKSFHSASLDESLRIVKNYLIAATAKDCSLMICFRQRTKEDSSSIYNNIYLESTKQAFDFKAKDIEEEKKSVKLHTIDYNGTDYWNSIVLNHPSTFDSIAMEPEIKGMLLEDLNLFLGRKEYYKRVGKAWKRGYLLYGPPGTGKSSLIAAMANYLRFDIYDLDLKEVQCNSDLRRLLIGTGSKSILVIEDIDCSLQLHNREDAHGTNDDDKVTLSGLLNFIDGLWSSCGEERIVICTTNHKERLDPALLRPGRMDLHIHMSYCSFTAFKTLASNYLGIQNHHHPMFDDIQGLLDKVNATPAEVAGELMKSENVDIALKGLINFLQSKHNTSK